MRDPSSPPPSAGPGPPTVFTVIGPLVPSDVPRLCAEAHALLVDVEPGTRVECDVGALGTPDTVALDALARLQLTARRLGHRVELRDASPALRALLRRLGLCDAVPLADDPPASDHPPASGDPPSDQLDTQPGEGP